MIAVDYENATSSENTMEGEINEGSSQNIGSDFLHKEQRDEEEALCWLFNSFHQSYSVAEHFSHHVLYFDEK